MKKKKLKKLKKLRKQQALLSNDKMWSLVAAGSAMMVGMAVKALLNKSWKAVTKQNPPLNPASRDTSWKEAIAWTVASSVAIGVAELIARRGADTLWQKTLGEKPAKRNVSCYDISTRLEHIHRE